VRVMRLIMSGEEAGLHLGQQHLPQSGPSEPHVLLMPPITGAHAGQGVELHGLLDRPSRVAAAFSEDAPQLAIGVSVQDLVLDDDRPRIAPPLPADGEESFGAFAPRIFQERRASRHGAKYRPLVSILALQPAGSRFMQRE